MSKKGKVRPRDPPSVWPDYQHILYPSWRPAPPPKQRLKARPHGREKLAEQRDLLASWRAREIISKSCSRLSELCFPTGELGFPTGWSHAETPASCACCSANFIPSCGRCSELCSWTLIAKVSVEWNSEICAKNWTKSQLHSISSWCQGQWNLS